MKLNAPILFHDLKQKYTCDYYGPETTQLHLSRPEFYMDRETLFLSDHLYLATADHLPARPVIQENVVLVCIGKGIHLNYYKERCMLIIINEQADFFCLYQDIQYIFNRYDEWNDQLFSLFKKDADMQKILDASLSIFGRLLGVIDADFNYLCISHGTEGTYSGLWNDAVHNVPHEAFGQFLGNGNFYTHIRQPLHLEYPGCNTLCVNLFDAHDTYIGCLVIDCAEGAFSARDDSLAIYLGQILEESLNRNGYLIFNEHNTLKLLLRDVLNEMPITPQNRLLLRANDRDRRYVCVSMHSTAAAASTSIYSNYICNIFETNFPNSIAFAYQHTVVGFIEISYYLGTHDEYQNNLSHVLQNLLETLQLTAGISNDFSDLENVRLYHSQAEIAYKNGSITAPAARCCYFSSYALVEMISNSLGGLPAEMYYPKGLKKLLEHDADSGVSYLETLQVFLDENMSYNRTAEALYIHRSTLTARIARIERDLGLDLSDPNERLQLMILFKAMEINGIVKEQA